MRFRFAVLSILSLFAAASVAAPKGNPPVPVAATVRMGFPKTYNKMETWRLYGGYVQHLAQCSGMRFTNLAGINLMTGHDALDLLGEEKMTALLQEGRLQLTQVSTGQVPIAMDSAGGIPFAVRGDRATGKFHSYRLILIVKADSPYQKPIDLKGLRIAHTTPGSNSGNLAPRAYFPALGLEPEKTYRVLFSKGHERSIIGTQYGLWEAAAVASDQFERMARKGEIRRSDFRVLWSSDRFPASAWVMSRTLPPDTQNVIRKCTESYRIPSHVGELLEGADQFVSVDGMKDYAPVRFVLEQQQAGK